jgi:hypothetical protein
MPPIQDSSLPGYPFLRKAADGSVSVDVHVTPNAPRTQADGLHDGALRVRLNAPPVEGRANEALVEWLARTLGVSRAQIELARGATGRRKQLRVNATAAAVAKWNALEP